MTEVKRELLYLWSFCMRIGKIKTRGKRMGFRVLFLMFVLLAVSVPLYAQDIVPQGLQSMGESIQEAFTGDLAKVILGCCFAGSCIAYGYNKDNEKMKGKLIAVIVATGLLVISQQVIDKVWSVN
jgi:type IV secretory pathway VirB2 component (pilin)